MTKPIAHHPDTDHPQAAGQRVTRRTVLGAATAAGLAVAFGGIPQAVPEARAAGGPKPVTPNDLTMTGPSQFRWLTVKNSRIVLNPYDFNQAITEMQQADGPALPLSAGYFAHNDAIKINDLLMIYGHGPGTPSPTPPATTFDDDFDTLDPAWTLDDAAKALVADSALNLTLPGNAPRGWGSIDRQITVDLDQFPTALIDVTSCTGHWSLKVNDGTQAVDIALQGDTNQTGSLTYDIPAITGWSGTKTFTVRIFVIDLGTEVTVDRLAIQALPDSWLVGSTKRTVAWRPYALDFEAEWDTGALVQGFDIFHDTNSVTRLLKIQGVPTTGDHPSGLTIAGRYTGTPTFHSATGVLEVAGTDMSYAIALGAGRTIRYYASRTDLEIGGPELTSAGNQGYWAADLAGTNQAIGIGFGYRGEGANVPARALQASSLSGAVTDRLNRRRDISQVLGRVPRPQTFSLRDVTSRGVDADDVRLTYYRAFTFFDLNVLPPGPEVGYLYPQIAAGKPSMWNFGADGARPSASWDSLLAIQYFAYLDPDTAWKSFQGLMTLVDADGRLGGESLPSRKAQTAWILYSVTGDQRRLASIYDPLRRYLLWAEANPRWIFGDHDIADEKDLEFVASLLVDFTYAEKIAEAAGIPSDVDFWKQHHSNLLANCKSWFFPAGGTTLQYHYTEQSHPDSAGNTLWVTTALHVQGLENTQQKALLDRFNATFDPAQPLCGWGYPDVKAPDVTFTAYGLIDAGQPQTANLFVQGMLRGIVESKSFAEVYQLNNSGAPTGTGVRPSDFGPFNVIDFVWLLNGLRADYGKPAFVNLPTTSGGVDQLHTFGRQYSCRAGAAQQQVTVSGPAIVNGEYVLHAPVGQVVALPDSVLRH